MTSFKPIIVPGSRRKDGTFLVYIRVYHAGASRRLPTSLVCYPADLTRSGRIKSADILAKADELVRRMRGTLADVSPFDLEDRDVDWVVGRIKADLTAGDFQLDFFSFADTMLKGMTPGTRKAYAGALNALERYLGKRSIDVNDITRVMMSDFASWVDSQPSVPGIWLTTRTGRCSTCSTGMPVRVFPLLSEDPVHELGHQHRIVEEAFCMHDVFFCYNF